MLRSLRNKLQQTSWFNRNSIVSISEHHHQPAYTLYHNDTTDIHFQFTAFESPSQSTLNYDRIAAGQKDMGHPLTRRALAAAILTSFLAGLAVGLITHTNVTLTSPSNQENCPSSTKQVTDSCLSAKAAIE